MKRRISIVAAIAAIVISGALASQNTGTAQAATAPAPLPQMMGSTWS